MNIISARFYLRLGCVYDDHSEFWFYQEKAVLRALNIVNEKTTDVDEAESRALDSVRDYYNVCLDALRMRMNALGKSIPS